MAYLSLMSAPCLVDFTILRGLGDGSSGTVHLVRENETGGLYALKAIAKRKPCGRELKIDIVMTERNTLLDLRGDDFILQLRASFHDSRNFYFVTVREAIFKRNKAREFVLTISTAGISSCWRSPHPIIEGRLPTERSSVLHGRIGTIPTVSGAFYHSLYFGC
jgi:hypothetical protein